MEPAEHGEPIPISLIKGACVRVESVRGRVAPTKLGERQLSCRSSQAEGASVRHHAYAGSTSREGRGVLRRKASSKG